MATFCLNPDNHRERIKANLVAFLDKLPDNKAWEIVIRPLKNSRSLKQNNALFGVAYPPFVQALGVPINDIHDYFCEYVFGAIDINVMGKIKTKPVRSTTRDSQGNYDLISTEEFSFFYSQVQQRGAELGLYIPDPDPLHYQNN